MLAVSTSAPAPRSICTVMAMCGAEGTRRPRWRISTPLSKRGAASSRPETNCEDADASRVTAPPASDPVPRTANGMAPRPPSSMTAPSSRSAARMGATGRWEARASPWNSTVAAVSAATGGTKRITVPALPTSTRVPPAGRPGVTRQVPAGRSIGAGVDAGAQRGQRPGHQQRVPGVQRAGDRAGPVGERGEDQRPVGHGLRARQRHARPHRAGRGRRRPAPAILAGRLVRVHAASLGHFTWISSRSRGGRRGPAGSHQAGRRDGGMAGAGGTGAAGGQRPPPGGRATGRWPMFGRHVSWL